MYGALKATFFLGRAIAVLMVYSDTTIQWAVWWHILLYFRRPSPRIWLLKLYRTERNLGFSRRGLWILPFLCCDNTYYFIWHLSLFTSRRLAYFLKLWRVVNNVFVRRDANLQTVGKCSSTFSVKSMDKSVLLPAIHGNKTRGPRFKWN